MAGGTYNTATRAALLVQTAWNYYKILTAPPTGAPAQQEGPWRPPQWKGLPGDEAELVLVRSNIEGYFFDAVIREEHTSSLRITEHPVQTGANISDHSFMLPARLEMEIGMSDAMDSLIPGQFTGGKPKSVTAYEVLLGLQKYGTPLQVVTRLNLYRNMVIEQLHVPDTFKTMHGLRCMVTFKQILTAEVRTVKVSARPQVTKETQKGPVQAKPVDQGSFMSNILKELGIEK